MSMTKKVSVIKFRHYSAMMKPWYVSKKSKEKEGTSLKKKERLSNKALALAFALVLLIGLLPGNAFAQTQDTDNADVIAFTIGEEGYWLGDTWVLSDAAPYLQADRIMVPVAHAARALGAEVLWNADTREVEVHHNNDTYTLTIGSTRLLKNGELLEEMDTVPVIQNIGNGLGRTMLPVSRLARVLNVEYTWNPQSSTASFLPLAEVDGPLVYDAPGIYGPEEGILTIEGDVLITAGGITLQNMIITGTLTMDEGVEEDTLILHNVTVEKVTILGSGMRLITQGKTHIKELIITPTATDTTLETSDDTIIDKAVVDGEDAMFEGGKDTVKKVEGDEKDSLVDKDNVVVSTTRNSGGGSRRSSSDDDSSSDPDPDPKEPELDPAILALIDAGWIPVATSDDLDAVRGVEETRTFGGNSGYKVDSTGGLDQKYIQVSDIDLDTAPWNTGEGWKPIGETELTAFTGHYNGQGYSIQKLLINRPSEDNIGLFGINKGTLQRIGIVNASVEGKNYVGCLVGSNSGTIHQSYSSGSVNGHDFVGGLAGASPGSGALIQQSFSMSSVDGTGDVGGLAGMTYGLVTESYANGSVTGNRAGGLIGACWMSVTNAYATGKVTGSSASGGLIGQGGYGLSGVYYDLDSTQQSDAGKGVPKPTNEMIRQNTFSEWSFESIWAIIDEVSYPYFKWQGTDNIPYPLSPLDEHPDFTFQVYADSATITGYTGEGGNITIPSTYQSKPVTAIGNNVFKNNTDITGVTFPGSLEHIGDYAFERCTNLTEVNFSEGLKVIGYTAFYGCTGLTEVVIPNTVEVIDSWAFQGCTNLTTITIGNHNRLVIRTGACYDSTGITTIIMLGSNTTFEGDFLESGNKNFQNVYTSYGAGTYTGTYSGTWTVQDK